MLDRFLNTPLDTGRFSRKFPNLILLYVPIQKRKEILQIITNIYSIINLIL